MDFFVLLQMPKFENSLQYEIFTGVQRGSMLLDYQFKLSTQTDIHTLYTKFLFDTHVDNNLEKSTAKPSCYLRDEQVFALWSQTNVTASTSDLLRMLLRGCIVWNEEALSRWPRHHGTSRGQRCNTTDLFDHQILKAL